jgi:ribonucleoside-diphosphate reductase alpha chain
VGKESNWVFEYPTKAPEGAITRNDVTAIDQLTIWKRFALNWCEHKPSITIYIKEHEWMSVGAWVWENFDIVNGISFLPSEDDGHIYDAAPNEDITEERYEELLKDVPIVKWDDFHESEDTTTSSQEMACSAGGCELT